MDEYGTFQTTSSDYDDLTENLREFGTIVFPFSGNDIDCQIILISNRYKKLGTMPFGGKPDGRTYVAIFGKGCHHFDFKRDTHASYISEKLNIDQISAGFIGTLFKELSKRISEK